jgi:hypothetical protein
LIRDDSYRSTEKNFAVAQLLHIDPLLHGAYIRFTSHQENQPRAAAIGRKTLAQRLALSN